MRAVGRDFVIQTKDPNDKDMIIPKGSLVFMPVICNFRNSVIFKDHAKFDPLRWEFPSEDMTKAWMPFGVGNRDCLGQSLANGEMQSILKRVCANFNFEVVEEGTVAFSNTLKPVGVRLRAKKI
jgi:cytochrome P450